MDTLSTYLNDHLAGAGSALSLARRAAHREEDTPLGHFLGQLAEAIAADRGALEQIMELLQIRPGRLRQGLAWVGERAGRLAQGARGVPAALLRLQELELLALGVEGKHALWEALRQLEVVHPNLAGVDLDELIRRADEQRTQLESWRLAAVVAAFPVELERESAPQG